MKKPLKLPVDYQDESANLDRSLTLLGRLCTAANYDEEVDALLVQEIGFAIEHYLRKRNALESLFGRVEHHNDAEFKAMVNGFRRRMKNFGNTD